MTNSQKVKISPSILSADFTRLGEQVAEVTKAGADYLHIDVMDGQFAPQITIGPSVVAAIRKCTNIPLDLHLMIEAPENQVNQFASAGANIITVHIETCPHLHHVIQIIKDKGVKAGVAVNPATSLSLLDDILPDVDMVVVMTVNPGFSGQSFMESIVGKIARLRAELDKRGLNAELEVDGGVNEKTASSVVKAGGRVLVAGSAVFNSRESISDAIKRLRESFA